MDTGGTFLRIKVLKCEADYSHPSNAEDKNVWRFISSPPHTLIVWCLGTGQLYLLCLSSLKWTRHWWKHM